MYDVSRVSGHRTRDIRRIQHALMVHRQLPQVAEVLNVQVRRHGADEYGLVLEPIREGVQNTNRHDDDRASFNIDVVITHSSTRRTRLGYAAAVRLHRPAPAEGLTCGPLVSELVARRPPNAFSSRDCAFVKGQRDVGSPSHRKEVRKWAFFKMSASSRRTQFSRRRREGSSRSPVAQLSRRPHRCRLRPAGETHCLCPLGPDRGRFRRPTCHWPAPAQWSAL